MSLTTALLFLFLPHNQEYSSPSPAAPCRHPRCRSPPPLPTAASTGRRRLSCRLPPVSLAPTPRYRTPTPPLAIAAAAGRLHRFWPHPLRLLHRRCWPPPSPAAAAAAVRSRRPPPPPPSAAAAACHCRFGRQLPPPPAAAASASDCCYCRPQHSAVVANASTKTVVDGVGRWGFGCLWTMQASAELQCQAW